MENVMNQIEKYHDLSRGCMIGLVLSMVVTVILYRKLDMREVIRYFKRRRKRMFLLMLIGMTVFGGRKISAEAAQGQMDTFQTFLEVEVLPGSEQPEDCFYTEDEDIFYVKNLDQLPDIKIKMKFLMEQELFDGDKIRLEYRLNKSKEWKLLIDENAQWMNPLEGQFEIIYEFDGTENQEGMYEFRVNYEDASGQNNEQILPEKYVFDKRDPEFESVWMSELDEELLSDEENKNLEPYYNAAKEIRWTFRVLENNLDTEQTSISVAAVDRNGELLKEYPVQLDNQTMEMVFQEDGHYNIEVVLTDKCGNTKTYEKHFALDYTEPEKPKFSYTIEQGTLLSRVMSQLTFGYFAKEQIVAKVEVEDSVSGVDKIVYTYEDVETKEIYTASVEPLAHEKNKNLFYTEIKLPYSFKGNLKVYSVDKKGNKTEEQSDIGVIAESEEKHLRTSYASVEMTAKGKKYANYFNSDVPIRFQAQDKYSGIGMISYTAGQELLQNVSYRDETEIITKQIKRDYTIPASSNHGNNLTLGLEVTDNAGYVTVVTEDKLPVIHIDIVKPKINIAYDYNDAQNGKYYSKERVATVSVKEKNFDPKDVKFSIEGPEVEIGSWSHEAASGCEGGNDFKNTKHSDQCVWKCTVRFYKDGDYRFGFSCTDLAGNTGICEKVDEFVIDQTKPVVSVDYDNQMVKNEFYFNKARIATITVHEKNFSQEDVMLQITANHENVAPISGWSSIGEKHQMKISYDYDAQFLFDIACQDLAGNAADDYAEDFFVIDQTKPEILIDEVFDRSANQNVVSPLISVTDEYYMADSTWIEMVGWYNGMLDFAQNKVSLKNGEIIRMEDIEHKPERDDVYRLTVGAEDLAGNVAKRTITFSINRYGSVYTVGDLTEQLAGEGGTYYTTKEIPIKITEINVDTLVFHEIICNLNGKLKTLREGEDYKVIESGDSASWKRYEYEIFQENFAEEGHYILTIYSKDRAGNLSDNHSKGKKIAFAVDKTAPTVLISGVENNGRYREQSRELTVDVEDNLSLSQTTIYLDENKYVFDNEKFSITVDGKNTWQRLKVESKDLAGNNIITEEIYFLVSPSLWVQFYNHKILFWGSMIGLGCFACGCGIFVFCRNRKKKS